MNFTALVVHGLSALSLYSHVIGVRLLVLAAGVIGVSSLLLGLAWAGGLSDGPNFFLALGLLSLLLQGTLGGLLFVFLLLSLRQMAVVVPSRDFSLFVRRCLDWPLATAGGEQAVE